MRGLSRLHARMIRLELATNQGRLSEKDANSRLLDALQAASRGLSAVAGDHNLVRYRGTA